MNKGSLVSEISRRTAIQPSSVARVVDAVIDVVRERVARGERVILSGFGTFERVRRNPRTGRNPHNGDAVPIPARNAPAFRASGAFRETVATRRRTAPRKPARKTSTRRS
jgi:DNA-binding protein HU-beta